MRKVVIVIMVALLVGCVGVMGIGVFLVRNLMDASRDNVIEVMQESLYQSSVEAISGAGSGTVRLRDRDLTVNNATVAGEAGWETGTSGTVVYGFDVWFTPDAIYLGIGKDAMFSGVPTVEDGRLDLTDVQAIDVPAFMSLMTEDEFESVMERGLNDAFAAHDLMPTGVTLANGVMTVNVTPVDDSARMVSPFR